MYTALVEGQAVLCTRTNLATYAKGNYGYHLFLIALYFLTSRLRPKEK